MPTQSKFHYVQIGVLLAGTMFAWFTVIMDFARFYASEGTFFKIADCVYPNPVTTPCFYGAFAFVLGLVWAIKLLKKDPEGLRKGERNLTWFLVAGNIFAWSNFSNLVYHFYNVPLGQGVSCSGVPAASPFTTPCFYGASLFLASLLVTIAYGWYLKKKI